MILNELVVENIGPYKGKNSFDFRPKFKPTRRPIILIGGHNGTGKTTLFEAIGLCLYGDTVKRKRMSKSEYQRFVRGYLHHGKNGQLQENKARVEVEFEFSHLGEKHTYRVIRGWVVEENEVRESLTLLKDGTQLSELSQGHWQDFLKELIPPALSQLFFFDGEKIQNLAEQRTSKGELQLSMKALLGLDVVEQLETDLRIYLRKAAKSGGHRDIQQELEDVRESLSKQEQLVEIAVQRKGQLLAKRDLKLAEIEKAEQKLAAEGGSFAKQRTLHLWAQRSLDLKINHIETQLRELSSDLLPFTFCATINDTLREQLISENEFRSWEAGQKHLLNWYSRIENELLDQTLWKGLNINKSEAKKVSATLLKKLKPSCKKPESLKGVTPLHNPSQSQFTKLLRGLEWGSKQGRALLVSLSEDLEELTIQRRNIERDLKAAPDEELISPLIEHLNELHRQAGAVNQQLKHAEEQVRQSMFVFTEIQRRELKLLEKLEIKGKHGTRVRLAKMARKVLESYQQELTTQKIDLFTTQFMNNFHYLARKKNLLTGIAVDPKTFEVSIYKSEKTKFPHEKLSAGEREIYAIALLWALLQLSGRSLPLVIDTPLGRLDQTHRDNLITSFFPNASHQTIILSTDTEVDNELFEKIKPYVAHAYRLEEQEGVTSVTKGYFWAKGVPT